MTASTIRGKIILFWINSPDPVKLAALTEEQPAFNVNFFLYKEQSLLDSSGLTMAAPYISNHQC